MTGDPWPRRVPSVVENECRSHLMMCETKLPVRGGTRTRSRSVAIRPGFESALRHRQARITARVSGDAPSPCRLARSARPSSARCSRRLASVSPPRGRRLSSSRLSSRRVVAETRARRWPPLQTVSFLSLTAFSPDPSRSRAPSRRRPLAAPRGQLVYVPAAPRRPQRRGGQRSIPPGAGFLYLTGVEEPGYRALFGTGADALRPHRSASAPRWTLVRRATFRSWLRRTTARQWCISRTSTIRRSARARWKARPSSSRL